MPMTCKQTNLMRCTFSLTMLLPSMTSLRWCTHASFWDVCIHATCSCSMSPEFSYHFVLCPGGTEHSEGSGMFTYPRFGCVQFPEAQVPLPFFV